MSDVGNTPVIAVLGNYEYDSDAQKWQNALEQRGITVLENTIVITETTHGPVCTRGFGDVFSNKFRYTGFPPECRYLPKLSLTHDPAGALHPQVSGLIFAGHTHCGQVNLPWIGPLWIPSSVDKDASCGWFRDAQRHLYVAAGIGHSIFPVRIGTQSSWDIFDVTFLPG